MDVGACVGTLVVCPGVRCIKIPLNKEENLTETHLIQIQLPSLIRHPAPSLALSYSYNPQLSPSLCLVFKQHLGERSGAEVPAVLQQMGA